ncbi:MAG: hypothetical protein DWQ36_17570 [Acidobacteria bacterium]|nr:MAG: hypothetical protein DWQ30_15980 [Acidobacteriota bacterium]REK04250.1 MAG: hypothetical protein DWQ36_17570 [Acidobacteriota bacterium]
MHRIASVGLTSLTCLTFLAAAVTAADSWPSFRGPAARGVADGSALPLQWNVEDGTNVRWSRELPGDGHSSPVVSGGRVYVVSAESDAETELVLGDEGGIGLAKDLRREFVWRLSALDAASGEVVWQREPYRGAPRANRHVKSSQANATPATDGKVVVAIFGSQGLVAWSRDGEELWRVDLGVLDPGLFGDPASHWGHASSPVIDGDRVFVQVDRHADSYVAAYDLSTGAPIWKVERQEKPVWATPTVHHGEGRSQLIVLGGDFDRGLDPATGEELWRFPRDLEVKTPTPFVAGDLVVLSGGYRGREVHAVRLDASGLVEGDELAWTSEAGGPYTSTPVAYRGRIYFARDTGVWNVLDLASGERLHRERIDGAYSASPIAADGRIYLPAEEGVVRVLSAEPPFEVLASNDMGAPCMASPAVAGQTLFLRCGTTLWAIAASAAG